MADIEMWTVYYRPSDFPREEYVTRHFSLSADGEKTLDRAFSLTLDQARHWILQNGGSYNLLRQPDDDPVIVETWLA